MLDDRCIGFLNHLFDGVYIVDTDRKILFWNESAEKITGYSATEVLGKSCSDNLLRHVTTLGTPLCENGCPLNETIADGVSRSIDVYLHHKLGHRVPVQVRSSPIHDQNGVICGAVEIFTDNSRHENMFRKFKDMQRSLYQDVLTGIGNRKFADIRMAELMGAFIRQKQVFGVLFVDIDLFKHVNDRYGHGIGDKVIKLVAQNLQHGLRPTDLACRFGGEEFLCLLPNVDREDMQRVAERLRLLVECSWLDTDMGKILVTVSIGGALVRKGDNELCLVDRADRCMYMAKQNGRNSVVISED
jgi:diguanylate cyclase (GGDEF)-like protein/PAS domain S-box-containing protein